VYNNLEYPTSEHLFQALKFVDTNPELAETIRTLPAPREAFQAARDNWGDARNDWPEVRVQMMEKALRAKFDQYPDLREALLETGQAQLIEDSPVDSFWGWGSEQKGVNALGKLLMVLRAQYRVEDALKELDTAKQLLDDIA